jgi:hypothetical protein
VRKNLEAMQENEIHSRLDLRYYERKAEAVRDPR